MSLRTRLMILVTSLMGLGVLATAGVLAYTSWHAIMSQAKDDGLLIARLLARGASVAYQVPNIVEDVLGEQMTTQAYLAAHLVDVAVEGGIPARELDARLAQVAARTVVDEIWVTDQTGANAYRSRPDLEIDFTTGGAGTREAEVFAPLLTGTKFAMVPQSFEREADNLTMKYAGVRGIDANRIVLVANEASFLDDLRARIGLEHLVRRILAGGHVSSIWVYDDNLEPLIKANAPGVRVNESSVGRESAPLQRVINGGAPESWLQDNQLMVMAPILDQDNLVMGAALVRLPTDRLMESLYKNLWLAAGVAGVLMLVGVFASGLLARHVARPVLAIADAATAVETKNFDPAVLQPVAGRKDELGHLAEVFQTMAATVFRREEELDALVRERTRELREKHEQLAAAKKQMDDELAIAQALQKAILPQEWPDGNGLEGAATMEPAKEMGGDFYDFFDLPDGRLAFVMADVSGKGGSGRVLHGGVAHGDPQFRPRDSQSRHVRRTGQRRVVPPEPDGAVRHRFLCRARREDRRGGIRQRRAQSALRGAGRRIGRGGAGDRRHGARGDGRPAVQAEDHADDSRRHLVPVYRRGCRRR